MVSMCRHVRPRSVPRRVLAMPTWREPLGWRLMGSHRIEGNPNPKEKRDLRSPGGHHFGKTPVLFREITVHSYYNRT